MAKNACQAYLNRAVCRHMHKLRATVENIYRPACNLYLKLPPIYFRNSMKGRRSFISHLNSRHPVYNSHHMLDRPRPVCFLPGPTVLFELGSSPREFGLSFVLPCLTQDLMSSSEMIPNCF